MDWGSYISRELCGRKGGLPVLNSLSLGCGRSAGAWEQQLSTARTRTRTLTDCDNVSQVRDNVSQSCDNVSTILRVLQLRLRVITDSK
jgi:hypothetical protein